MKRIINTLSLMTVLMLGICFFSSEAKAVSSTSLAGQVSTMSTALNLRKAPSLSSEVIRQIGKGKYLTLLEKEGAWWKVEYAKGKTAYAHADYIKVVPSTVMYVTTEGGNLNVRASAKTDGKIKTTLKNGTLVLKIKEKNSFSRIIYGGSKTGYVSSLYLSEKKPTEKYEKISLDVPSYKQTDSRWANIKIGTQGDTIRSSGCTTTALAMTESFHLGKSVTPAHMVKRLNYSSSGMLYWPTDYKTELITKENYLSKLYSLLKEGKPVVLGMKKTSGSQHWVVVTGHSKSASALSDSAFTINDPGSSSRKTLDAFVKAYPVAYKIAYKK